MSEPVPFTVIGGFLGAGKTTLLNRLLAGADGRRFAVLVNDFGALDIDGRLIAAHGGDTIALANGCVCCTIGDSLVSTVMALLEKPAQFDHIVVEASGVADPGRIADLGVLDERMSRNGVVVVVDAAEVRARAADRRVGDTVRRQLEAADLIVLNKVDLAEDIAVMRCWLSTHSTAPVLEARHCEVPLDLLFGLDRHGTSGKPTPSASFRSWAYSWPEPVDRGALLEMLRDAAVLRGKGIVRFSDSPDRRSVVHLVGKRLDVSDAGPWSDTKDSQLVLLGLRPVLRSLPEGRERMGDRLKDRVAIIVGAGSSGPGWGNGKCTAVTFAREGARVFCVDRKRAAAEETVGLIAKEGGEATAFECDASNSAQVKAMVDACVAKWGRIDILDNNVGIGSTGGPVELSEDDWHKVFDVNVTSFFLTAKHVLPIMEKQKKGAIVNVSSIASIRVPKGISYIAYNASKGAVNSLTMAIASEYAEKGIRCNAILPGLMHTPMIDFLAEEYAKGETDHNQAYDKMIAIRNRASPTGKMGTGWDTANAALFLASDEAAYVNGHLLVVDGGITTRA